jgi:putative hydrolase of the HAD superfamily
MVENGLEQIKAVIFDYIGTLVNCIGYNLAASKMKLYLALVNEGFKISVDNFLDAYSRAHEKYRKIRYGELCEVTNAIWVTEALNEIGYNIKPDDICLKTALNIFFKDFTDTLKLRAGAVKLFNQAASHGKKIGLLSNFTYAPLVHFSLDQLDINKYFNTIITSDENGWRKPSPHIFNDILKRLHVTSNEVIYVGDSPLEDIKGAKTAGFKTIFVRSQFHPIKHLTKYNITADFTAKNLHGVSEIFNQILK